MIPETIIYDTLKTSLKIIKDDYLNATDKTDSMLHKFFSGHKIEKFDFYEQSIGVFTKNDSYARNIQIGIGYNLNRAAYPHIHIMLPSENPDPAPIGGSEAVGMYEIDENTNEYKRIFDYGYTVTYNLLITSDNPMEVILIYNLLKFIMISIHHHLELQGLKNCKFSGNDLSFSDELVPPNIFHRNFNIDFSYDFEVLEFLANDFSKNFNIERTIKEQ